MTAPHPPIDLDDHAAVRTMLGSIPLRVRPRCTDVVALLAGGDHLARTVVLLDDVPGGLPQHERVRIFSRFWRKVRARTEAAEAAAVALVREGSREPTGDDLAAHDAIRATAAHAGITCLAMFLTTRDGTELLVPRPVSVDDAAS